MESKMKFREMTVLTTVLVALSWSATPALALKAGASAGGISAGVSTGGGRTKADVSLGGGGTDGSGAHATLGGGSGGGTNAGANASLGGSGGANVNGSASLGGSGGTQGNVNATLGGTDNPAATANATIGTGGTNGTNADVNATIGELNGLGTVGSGTPTGNVPPGTIGGILGGASAAPQDDPNNPTASTGTNGNQRLNSQLGGLAGLTPAELRSALNDLDPSDVRKIKKSCAQLKAGGGTRSAMAVCKVIASL
jgi:hypothetical protein